jgi:hypothetical protein
MLMSPKSRLYTLVKAWKNKPLHEVRDACGEPWLGLGSAALEEHQSWSKRQAISNEPIFNHQGTKLTGALFRPLLSIEDSQLLRMFMEGLDNIAYWYRSGRFIPGILPLPAHAIASTHFVDGVSDLILNSRLPVGIVSIAIYQSNPSDCLATSTEGLLRLRRLGVLVHLLNFSGSATQMRWIAEMEPEGIHVDISQLRNEQTLIELTTLTKHIQSQIYACNLTFVQDVENSIAIGASHSYGGLMMPPVSRHQMLHISDSRIAKAIFSLHPHKNQNGDM